ncbi:uncharacterized protein APUU_21544A [Aspergillus puulaauensis]|uniref:Uncharacterized protein n=1 Tax=Aspergillus puulaauensis TaxID=1220207 RepID=A0A7R7XGJ1_9EURO|nr:uncharacterized protein APUU_21544A [Aspergillus puulaauensis]BCS21112.1 hypothetical protein APUU_21544A [Aspergillus puulaauensis]
MASEKRPARMANIFMRSPFHTPFPANPDPNSTDHQSDSSTDHQSDNSTDHQSDNSEDDDLEIVNYEDAEPESASPEQARPKDADPEKAEKTKIGPEKRKQKANPENTSPDKTSTQEDSPEKIRPENAEHGNADHDNASHEDVKPQNADPEKAKKKKTNSEKGKQKANPGPKLSELDREGLTARRALLAERIKAIEKVRGSKAASRGHIDQEEQDEWNRWDKLTLMLGKVDMLLGDTAGQERALFRILGNRGTLRLREHTLYRLAALYRSKGEGEKAHFFCLQADGSGHDARNYTWNLAHRVGEYRSKIEDAWCEGDMSEFRGNIIMARALIQNLVGTLLEQDIQEKLEDLVHFVAATREKPQCLPTSGGA